MAREALVRMARGCFLAAVLLSGFAILCHTLTLCGVVLPSLPVRLMSPVTALVVFAYSATNLWRLLRPSETSTALAIVVGATGGLLSLLVVVSFVAMAVPVLSSDWMTPATALVLVLAGLSLVVGGLRPSMWTQQVEATAALLVAFAGLAVLLAQVLNVPVAAGHPLPGLVTGLGFLALGIGQTLGAGAQAWPVLVLLPNSSPRPQGRASLRATAFFVLLVLGTVCGTFARISYEDIQASARQRVASAAENQATAIADWFAERAADAAVVQRNVLVRDELRRALDNSASVAVRASVGDWLEAILTQYHYHSVALVDADGRVREVRAMVQAETVRPDVLNAVPIALTTEAVQFVDLPAFSDDSHQTLSWVIPTGGSPAVAAVVLTADPAQQLWPRINRWLDASPSAEAFLVRHEGDSVVFLNSPRLNPQAPSRVAIAQRPDLPAALAVGGMSSVVEANDYRNVPVLAAVRPVSGTPWALVVKIDSQESGQLFRESLWFIVVTIGASTILIVLAVGLIWFRRELQTSEHLLSLKAQRHRTARRLAEAGATAHTMTVVVEQSPSSIVITDLDGNIEYVNPAFTRATGYSRQEVIGKNPRILKSGELSRSDYEHLWATLLDGRTWRGELHNKRKDGTLFWESATISPLRNTSGRVTGYLAVKEDVTRQKAAAEDHARLEAQFAQAQKLESIGRLAGGVAHDFNNMLSVILGHAELALDTFSSDDPRREYLQEIRLAGERSTALTRQLLTFARKQTVRPIVLNLNESVEAMLKMLGRLVGEDITLRWQPGTNLWKAQIDPGQLDQILANLTVNARDAIEREGVITIDTGNEVLTDGHVVRNPSLRPGEFVRISVRDNGCGMSPEVLSHFFEPFFTTKESGKGTGLGAATVYGIVTQNSGLIDVESVVGEGTAIHVYLPRTETADGQVVTPDSSAIPRGTETIVVVEDEAAMLGMSSRMLEHAGYTVLAFSSATRALAELDPDRPIDLLLTDVVMPGINGRELAEAFRARLPDLKVLYMSGYTPDVIGHHGVLDDARHFIGKPFSTLDLTRRIRQLLDEVSNNPQS